MQADPHDAPRVAGNRTRGPLRATPGQHRRYGLELGVDLWRVPLLLCAVTLLLFVSTVSVDAAAARGRLTLPGWLSIGGIEDARAVLGAALGAVSTVLALIFSVALLVLAMAANAFGPRILYRFVRDGVTQVTIGLFLATFLHTLLTLVVARHEGARQFVPQLTLVCSIVLVVVSFAFLVVFSHRTAVSIQTQNVVAHIVADVHDALAERTAMVRSYRELPATPEGRVTVEAVAARCVAEGGLLRAWRTGFVQEVDVGDLVAAADRTDALLRVLHRPGQFVLENAPLCEVLPAAHTATLAPAVRRAVKIGTHRTLKQDFEFGIAQLVEIALRALSAGVNDTFTGLTCIDWLGDAIRVIHQTPAPRGAVLGATGALRLLWSPPRFERVLKAAFQQIRQAGAGNAAVQIRLLQTFARLAPQFADGPSREALLRQVEAVWAAVSRDALVEADRGDVEATYGAARDALATDCGRS